MYKIIKMENVHCVGCGNCCKKHWLIRLTSEYEKSLFVDDIVFGNFIWTDQCKYFLNGRCSIHENNPRKCKEYFCEKYFK